MENQNKTKRFPAIGDIAAMVVLFFASQLFVGAIISYLGFTQPATSAIDATDIETYMSEQLALGKYIAVIYPISMLFSIGVLWLYVRLRGGRQAIKIRHSTSGFNPSVVLVGIVWLLAAQILLEPLMTILPPSDGSGVGRGVWACFTAMISAPIFEELLCRGLIFETLRKRWGTMLSIVISSLLFGLMHMEPATVIVAIVAGMIFGVLYVRTSSLYTTIIIHSVNNAMAFALICIGVGDVSLYEIMGGGKLYWIIYGLSAAIFIACSIEAYFQVFRRQKAN